MKYQQLILFLEKAHTHFQNRTLSTINRSLVLRNWLFGRYIVEYEQQGEDRAKYGKGILKKLSKELTHHIGKGFSEDNLGLMRKFYGKEAFNQSWSLRGMRLQINSALYERLLKSKNRDKIMELSQKGQVLSNSQDIVQEPYILEFLHLKEDISYSENQFEAAIINKLVHFLLELGKGFLFEARQKRFSFDESHFYVDLVFYNRLMRCYVLIDLKIEKLTHQDLGQMQMYVNYFDRCVKTDDESPTIGIVLCKEKSDFIVELTLPKDSNLYASKYQLYLPSKEDFIRQIEEVREGVVRYGS